MENMKTIFHREIRNYFNTPIGYVFAVGALFFNFIFFFYGIFDIIPAFFETKLASVKSYLNLLPVTYILMVPAVTMRIWAEEKKSGTFELLMTLPFTEAELVIGKFLGALTFISLLILAVIPLSISIMILGDLDPGSTLTMIIGSILMAGAYISTGMVISALTGEQIVAFIITFFISLFMFISNYYIVSQHLPPQAAQWIGFFSHSYHFGSFTRGMISASDTVYYLSFTSLMLYFNVLILRREK